MTCYKKLLTMGFLLFFCLGLSCFASNAEITERLTILENLNRMESIELALLRKALKKEILLSKSVKKNLLNLKALNKSLMISNENLKNYIIKSEKQIKDSKIQSEKDKNELIALRDSNKKKDELYKKLKISSDLEKWAYFGTGVVVVSVIYWITHRYLE